MTDAPAQPAPLQGVRYDPSPAAGGAPTVFGVPHRTFASAISDPERLKAWKAFTDDFWRVDAAATPTSKNSFLFRRGFLRDKWALYGLDRNDIEAYLSDLQARLLYRANTIYAEVLENRLLLLQVMEGSFRTPRVYALRDPDEGEVVFADVWEAARRPGSEQAVTAYVQPLNSSVRGKTAVFRIEEGTFEGAGKGGPVARMDAVIRDWAEAAGSPYLIVEPLEGGSFARSLSPDAPATLHVLMFRREGGWEPHLSGAVLRIGTAASAPSDAIEAGGLSASIDTETGTIDRVLGLTAAGRLEGVEAHPDTGRRLVGLALPGWAAFRETLTRFYDQSSYLRVAALDFRVDEDGYAFLGGGNMPDVAAMQAHRPLLADATVAAFLRAQKI